jgi:hypothetical protein
MIIGALILISLVNVLVFARLDDHAKRLAELERRKP